MTYAIGVFSVRFTEGIQDRYVFFLAVPLFCGTAAWLEQRRPSWPALAFGALVAAFVVGRSALELRSPTLVSPSSAWHQVIFGRTSELKARINIEALTAQRLMAVLALAACAAVLLARRRWPARPVVPLVVVAGLCAYGVAQTQYTMNQIAPHGGRLDAAAWKALDWVDDALPGRTQAPALLSDLGSPNDAMSVWWHVQFWNKDARPAYTFTADGLAQSTPTRAELDVERGRIPVADGSRYVLHGIGDRRFQIRGATVVAAQDSVELLRLADGGKLDWVLEAASQNGLVPVRQPATLRVFPPGDGTGQRVTISFTTNFQTAGDYRYRITGQDVDRRGLVRIGKSVTETIDVRPAAGGAAELRITAAGRVHPDYPLGGLLITDLRSQPLP
jgi:hypothetical protein